MVPALQRGLVGRDRETAEVSSFTAGIGGERRALVIEGELGIGKTRLLHEAVRRGREAGFRILSSSPGAADAKLSFSGLGDLLSEVVEDPALEIPDPQRRALEVALLLRDPEGEPPGALAVALAVRGTLVALAEKTAVLVALDDAQWLDDPSAAALGHAIRRVGTAPIGMLAVWHSEGSHHPDSVLLASLPQESRRFRVGRLEVGDLRTMLRSRLGLSLPRGRLDRLDRMCSGNPLAALEIGRAVIESGDSDLRGPAMPVPKELADVLRMRLSALGEGERGALLVLAAASEPTRSLVLAVAGGSAGAAPRRRPSSASRLAG